MHNVPGTHDVTCVAHYAVSESEESRKFSPTCRRLTLRRVHCVAQASISRHRKYNASACRERRRVWPAPGGELVTFQELAEGIVSAGW
jgi:hypothetical protein